jgi:hypothetical protein
MIRCFYHKAETVIFSESFGKYIDRNILFFILKLLKLIISVVVYEGLTEMSTEYEVGCCSS